MKYNRTFCATLPFGNCHEKSRRLNTSKLEKDLRDPRDNFYIQTVLGIWTKLPEEGAQVGTVAMHKRRLDTQMVKKGLEVSGPTQTNETSPWSAQTSWAKGIVSMPYDSSCLSASNSLYCLLLYCYFIILYFGNNCLNFSHNSLTFSHLQLSTDPWHRVK